MKRPNAAVAGLLNFRGECEQFSGHLSGAKAILQGFGIFDRDKLKAERVEYFTRGALEVVDGISQCQDVGERVVAIA